MPVAKKVNYPLVLMILFLCVILSLIYTVSLTEKAQTSTTVSQTHTSLKAAQSSTSQIKNPKSTAGIKDVNVIIDSVAINSPLSFTSPEKADKADLISIAFWCILLTEECESYDFTGKMMLIPKKQVEQVCLSLFENADLPEHKTVKSRGITFSYNEKTGLYSVPITGITPAYTAEIIDRKEKKGRIKIKADLIPTDKWTQSADGKIIKPKAQKSLNVTVKRKSDGTFTILGVSNK